MTSEGRNKHGCNGWHPQAAEGMLTRGFDTIIVEENLGPLLEVSIEILHEDEMKRKRKGQDAGTTGTPVTLGTKEGE